MRHILILLFSILALSCSKEIDIDQPDYQPQIVVDGWIESDQSAHIFLTQSSPFLTHYDSASIRNTFLNYAKITLTSSEGESEILTLYREKQFFPPFVYKSVAIKGKSDVRYDIKIEVKGKTLEASTTIPKNPNPIKLSMNASTDSSGILNALITPSIDSTIYLYTQVKSLKSKENYHASFMPCYRVQPTHAPFELPVWRVRETNLYLSDPQSHPYYKWPRYQYAIDDTVYVKIGATDATSFRVLKSLFTDHASMDNPFSFNGSRLETNIKGGIGRWTGIATNRILIYTGQENQ